MDGKFLCDDHEVFSEVSVLPELNVDGRFPCDVLSMVNSENGRDYGEYFLGNKMQTQCEPDFVDLDWLPETSLRFASSSHAGLIVDSRHFFVVKESTSVRSVLENLLIRNRLAGEVSRYVFETHTNQIIDCERCTTLKCAGLWRGNVFGWTLRDLHANPDFTGRGNLLDTSASFTMRGGGPVSHRPSVVSIHGDNFRVIQNKGGGACLFRALAQVLFGTEDRHQHVTDYVVAHWNDINDQDVTWGDSVLTYHGKTSPARYSRFMKHRSTFATELEVAVLRSYTLTRPFLSHAG